MRECCEVVSCYAPAVCIHLLDSILYINPCVNLFVSQNLWRDNGTELCASWRHRSFSRPRPRSRPGSRRRPRPKPRHHIPVIPGKESAGEASQAGGRGIKIYCNRFCLQMFVFFCLTLMWINSDSFSCLISDLLMCRYYLIISENILILPFFSFVKIMTFSELYFKNIPINNYTKQAFVQTRKKTRLMI